MGIVNIKNLIHDYRDEEENETVRAIDNVSLQIEAGQFIVILGHNGSGKSSLAKHINALLMPTEGTVWVDGIETTNNKRVWDIRQTAGMVFQNPDNQIVATMVEEDVAFGPENMAVPTDEIWRRVEKALGAVKMTAFRHKSPLKLSGGQKQRVAIAGIIAMEPKCIVLDEPTAMLDPVGRKEVIETLHQLNKEKKITIILITHHMNEAIDADRIFVMNKGKLVEQGTPKEIFSKVEEIKSYGLEVPQVTELGYMLKQSGLEIEDGILTVDELIKALGGQVCQ
ncbi:energy-coupling factor transporter ATPase [uncultured Eubacterium sp.]|uniref:energy-coupling factor transporter ATPase n=1 Tax=uncultured Eubacterium sp. TaxID=165185 RepID=UPI002671BA43|nr:energy-coupling factor transporter ATPase [uncultured Eubacterium sp.]